MFQLNSRLKEVVMERRHELEQQSKENAIAKAQQNKIKVSQTLFLVIFRFWMKFRI